MSECELCFCHSESDFALFCFFPLIFLSCRKDLRELPAISPRIVMVGKQTPLQRAVATPPFSAVSSGSVPSPAGEADIPTHAPESRARRARATTAVSQSSAMPGVVLSPTS